MGGGGRGGRRKGEEAGDRSKQSLWPEQLWSSFGGSECAEPGAGATRPHPAACVGPGLLSSSWLSTFEV